MNLYSASCPICGHRNKRLYLEDSEGWMECEKCGTLSLILKTTDTKTGKTAPAIESLAIDLQLRRT